MCTTFHQNEFNFMVDEVTSLCDLFKHSECNVDNHSVVMSVVNVICMTANDIDWTNALIKAFTCKF